VDRAAEAAARLVALGFEASCTAPDALEVDLAPNGTPGRSAAEVNALLVGGRFDVFRLKIEEPALEDIYLEKVGAQAALPDHLHIDRKAA
jgi:hypothetical protein